MFHPYQLHSLGKLYHEEALKQTRVRNLEHRTKAHREPHSEGQGLWSFSSWVGKLIGAAGLRSS